MASLAAVLDEIAGVLDASFAPSTGFYGEIQVVGRRNFNPTPPSVDVYPGDPFRETPDMAGFQETGGELILTVRARVTTADNIAGQDLLLRFMDEDDEIGIAAILMEDQSLNGLASTVYVEGNSGYLQYLEGDDGGTLLGCEWRVRVLRVIT